MDLETFVDNISYLKHILSPFILCSEWILSCYRWRHPKATLLILLVMNSIWFQSTTLSLIVLAVVSWTFLCFVGLKTDILNKSLPDTRPMPARKAKADIYQEYFKSVSQINGVVVELTKSAISFYEIIRWDDPRQSSARLRPLSRLRLRYLSLLCLLCDDFLECSFAS